MAAQQPRLCHAQKEALGARRYISNPLLVRGRKFHVRAYVLCVGSLAVYVYRRAPLARLRRTSEKISCFPLSTLRSSCHGTAHSAAPLASETTSPAGYGRCASCRVLPVAIDMR